MDLEVAIQLVQQSSDHRVIERLPIKQQYYPDDGSDKKLAIYLDTETTGFDSMSDQVIELAMILFEYSADGRIFRIRETFDEYQDPGRPIPEEITRITGITDEMVAGKQLNIERVNQLLNQAVIIIAHNASFDRSFAEHVSPVFKEKCWACSVEDIPWREEGLESAKLEYLAYRYGFFYEGHRADIDCYAGLHLLSKKLPQSNGRALSALLNSAKAPRYKVQAIHSPFDTKDQLKSRGYRWEDISHGQKCWVATILGDYLDEEKEFLEKNIYTKNQPSYEIKKISPFNRFSSRA